VFRHPVKAPIGTPSLFDVHRRIRLRPMLQRNTAGNSTL
jgi:hypothetical protein